MKPFSPGFLFWGIFLVVDLMSSLVICSEFLFLYDLVLESWMFLDIYSSLDFPIFSCKIVHNSVMIFCISVVSVITSLLHFVFLNLVFYFI